TSSTAAASKRFFVIVPCPIIASGCSTERQIDSDPWPAAELVQSRARRGRRNPFSVPYVSLPDENGKVPGRAVTTGPSTGWRFRLGASGQVLRTTILFFRSAHLILWHRSFPPSPFSASDCAMFRNRTPRSHVGVQP